MGTISLASPQNIRKYSKISKDFWADGKIRRVNVTPREAAIIRSFFDKNETKQIRRGINSERTDILVFRDTDRSIQLHTINKTTGNKRRYLVISIPEFGSRTPGKKIYYNRD